MMDNASGPDNYNPSLYWLVWTVATAVGWLLGTLINFVLIGLFRLDVLSAAVQANPDQASQSDVLLLMLASVAILLLLGGIIGALQWLVLRRQVPGLSRWAPFTALGVALGSLVALLFMGVGVGVTQWMLLRRVFNKTVWWLVISAVAWPAAYLIGNVAAASIESLPLAGAANALVSGAIVGAITGAALLWLLRQNRQVLDGLREEAEQAKQ